MAFACRVELDSINTSGDRLTTFVISYPRFVHSEFLTHRTMSRNSSSSRAIPTEKLIEQVMTDPAMPVWWGKNQSGMQAREELDAKAQESTKKQWLIARNQAVSAAEYLREDLGLHKQITNRILEPWMWITVIISATTYENFFKLRCHPDAQPELRHIAEMMRRAYSESRPKKLPDGAWHTPFYRPEEDGDLSIQDMIRVCVARCARVSYLTHDGKRDVAKDLELHDRLAESGHWSPFEHVAQAMGTSIPSGNFQGWFQHRKTFMNEHTGKGMP